MNIIIWLIIGGVVGWLASIIMRTDAQQGILMNVVVGIIGALIAGFLISPLLGIATINEGLSVGTFLVSLGGAVILLAIVCSPWFLYRAIRYRKYVGNAAQRMGRLPVSFNLDGDDAIWIHAVSVGEALTARALIADLRERYPGLRLFFSTTTLTGQQVARTRLQDTQHLLADVVVNRLDRPVGVDHADPVRSAPGLGQKALADPGVVAGVAALDLVGRAGPAGSSQSAKAASSRRRTSSSALEILEPRPRKPPAASATARACLTSPRRRSARSVGESWAARACA